MMHMADALVSVPVGVSMMAVSVGVLAWTVRHLRQKSRNDIVPMMGVMGAFIFAVQMVNLTLPSTGSSGHLTGAILLSALLGYHAAFLVMTAILVLQSLFFADGGLLALGCNVFNMAFFGCFIAYPLVFSPIAAGGCTRKRIWVAALLACVVSAQLGAFGVVLETLISGVTELPFKVFTLLMQPIHLAIGLVEGILTALLLSFVLHADPTKKEPLNRKISWKRRSVYIGIASLVIAGGVSLLSSEKPDALESAVTRAAVQPIPTNKTPVHAQASEIQAATARMAAYQVPHTKKTFGRSASGIIGSLMTLGVIIVLGFLVSWRKRRC